MQIEIIKRKTEELDELADKIEELGIKVIKGIPFSHDPLTHVACGDYVWSIPSGEIKKNQRTFIKLYQKWYSISLQLVDEYLNKEREIEFKDIYSDILDYLQPNGREYSTDKNLFIDKFLNKYDIQRGILLSIPDIIEVKEMKLRKLISADFVETELEEAELLFNHEFTRGAGALAGVALEKHLETMCQLNDVSYKPKATIDPLATELYRNNRLDITELKKVQHLASIRNKCDHPEEITKEEVKELIDGAKKFIINH
ncbi:MULTISPECIES: hypothetical protein [Methanobacterium]|uniref:DUF4145 domain-containing protein n=1 Tax=Methanobacterium bryantii TaxID=2161 RepID=A0A2A2H4W6_METBR|nr:MULTISPECIES: hypothetical protein [Methanobacterium]OEC88280.1 hypothetical protein A9507_05015 [Methanobacterium sp. A39]PAV04469.1 hypothetical protein ASJ80_06430 [Methanobacterium bryantii]